MTPTHIKSLTHRGYERSVGRGWLGSHRLPIQKLILLCPGFKETGPATCADDEEGRGGEGREDRRGKEREEGEVAVEEWHHLPWNVTIISSLSLAVYRGDIILSLPLPPPFLVYVAEGGCLFVCTRAGVRVWEWVCAWEHFFKGGMSGCLSALSLPLSCL